MSVPARLCLAMTLLTIVLPLAVTQEHEEDHLVSFVRHTLCGRKGLCPYVKRLIPHTFGFGIDSGHLLSNNEPPSLCGNLCTSDSKCPGYQKCCPTNCGYACLDPVYVTEQ